MKEVLEKNLPTIVLWMLFYLVVIAVFLHLSLGYDFQAILPIIGIVLLSDFIIMLMFLFWLYF